MNEAAAGELSPGMSLRDGPLRSRLKIPPTDERSSVMIQAEEEQLQDSASFQACWAASSPAYLTVTLLPLPVQGHARAMAPAGDVGGGGGGAATTAGTG